MFSAKTYGCAEMRLQTDKSKAFVKFRVYPEFHGSFAAVGLQSPHSRTFPINLPKKLYFG